MSSPLVVVVDLDGTLCNSGHRDHLAQAGQWDEFHALLMDDEPWQDVQLLVKTLSFTNMVVIGLTGRNERYRNATMGWLACHDIRPDRLLMRPDDSYLSDHELKPALLADYLLSSGLSQQDVWFILEDRDKVVEAWRNAGYNCWQVRPGGY
jgi:hypothetical protein